MLDAPMPLLTPSVHPVLRFFLHLISRGAQTCAKTRASDLPTTIGCTDAMGIGSSDATDFSRTRPIQRFFEFLLRVLLCMAFFTSSLGSRNVHLTKPLVPLIALSFDHQNHSKWHKWCHVRFNLPFLVIDDNTIKASIIFARIDKFNHLIPIETTYTCLDAYHHCAMFVTQAKGGVEATNSMELLSYLYLLPSSI